MDKTSDLTFLRIVAEQADAYIHTDTLFYPIGAIHGMQMPQLTIGTWLETEWRVGAMALEVAELDLVKAARGEIQRVRNRARDLYSTKVRREFKSRLDSWSWYLDDLPNGASGYASQVHLRLKLEFLKNDVNQLEFELRRLAGCDGQLRGVFTVGQFVWEEPLSAIAPRDAMWWLYGMPR